MKKSLFITSSTFFLFLFAFLFVNLNQIKPLFAQTTPACTYTPDTIGLGGSITVTSLNGLAGEIRVAGAFWPQPATGSVPLGTILANKTLSATLPLISTPQITAGGYAVRGPFGVLCTTTNGGTQLSVIDSNAGSPGGAECANFTTCSTIPGAPTPPGFTSQSFIVDLVSKFLPVALGLGGFLAIIVVVVSAIQFVTSNGNPDGAAAARGRLIFALVGFVLLILAFTLTKVIDTIFLKSGAV